MTVRKDSHGVAVARLAPDFSKLQYMNHLFGSIIRLLYKLTRLLVTPEMLLLLIFLGIAAMILLSDLPLFLRLY